jgi:hypothetical protein
LPSNPSIGNHWELSLYDNSTIKLVSQTFASNVSTSSTVVGAGGLDLFIFQATQAGTGGIAFSEISPLTKQQAPLFIRWSSRCKGWLELKNASNNIKTIKKAFLLA